MGKSGVCRRIEGIWREEYGLERGGGGYCVLDVEGIEGRGWEGRDWKDGVDEYLEKEGRWDEENSEDDRD